VALPALDHRGGDIRVGVVGGDGVETIDRKLGNQQNGCMKTTLDLPDKLVKQVKLRALRDGKKLKETVAELLRKGLAVEEQELEPPVLTRDKKTGFPVIQCKHPAPPGQELTPEQIAEILHEQEVEWFLDISRR
jgi:hypothetical protein